MKVTNLIQNIGKCRDLIESKDFAKILNNIYLFEKTYKNVKIQVDKFIKDSSYELDFTFYDLQELSDEIAAYIADFPNQFNVQHFIDKISENRKIDDNILKKFTSDICNKYFVDARLRECQKILAYCAFTMWICLNGNKNECNK